jgi:hypothetical protein
LTSGFISGFTSTTFCGGLGTTTGFSTGLGGSTGFGGSGGFSGGFGGTGKGSTGVVMVFFAATGFSTGLIGSVSLGGVMTFLGGGLGNGCVIGKFSITTVSRTARCTGAVCSSNHNKAMCAIETTNSAGRESGVSGSWGAVVVKIISVMIKAFETCSTRVFAAKPVMHPAIKQRTR